MVRVNTSEGMSRVLGGRKPTPIICPYGGIGIHNGLKIRRSNAYWFKSS